VVVALLDAFLGIDGAENLPKKPANGPRLKVCLPTKSKTYFDVFKNTF